MSSNEDVQCQVCSTWYSQSNWYKHMKQGCKQCRQCQRYYTDYENHAALYHRRAIYECQQCGRAFKRVGNLRTHIKDKQCETCLLGCGRSHTRGKKGRAHHEKNCPAARGLRQLQVQPPGVSGDAISDGVQPNGNTEGDDMPVHQRGDASALRPSPLELIDEYSVRATAAIEQANREFGLQRDRAPQNCRSKSDAPAMLELLAKVSIGRPVTAADAWKPDLPNETIIVCTMAEAVEMFKQGPLHIPVLVKAACKTEQRLTISSVLDTLRMRGSLDLHDFSKPLEKAKDGSLINMHMPDRYPSATAVRIFNERRTTGGLPVNLLNLGCLKENAIPACFSNNKEYDPMRTRTDNGKSETPEWRDLDDCLVFHLLATKGAAHLQHVDRHGVYTTALTEEGRKLWLMWPGLELEELQTREVPDGGVAVLIDEGDMLIQPPNTLHAPITLENTLMTGTMHWHSSHLLDILRHTKAQVIDPVLTNETLARQFLPKMKSLLRQWEVDLADPTKKPLYTWPPAESLAECVKIVQWLDDGCKCEGRCVKGTKNACKCKQMGRVCDTRCHFSEADKPCCLEKVKASRVEVSFKTAGKRKNMHGLGQGMRKSQRNRS